MDAYFRQGLDKASAGDRTRMLVFYCLRNCWMSWNAAKRALSCGYARVAWYPEGTDGWSEAGLPLEPREPEPRPDVSE
jgi:PQQ-dependent catabolism-associated CXXCW motif protein